MIYADVPSFLQLDSEKTVRVDSYVFFSVMSQNMKRESQGNVAARSLYCLRNASIFASRFLKSLQEVTRR